MRLGLSSAAAPDASLAGLVDACDRRGLPALEVVDGHGHGISPADVAASVARVAEVRDGNVGIVACRTGWEIDAARLADLSVALGVPVVIAGPEDSTRRIRRARSVVRYGGHALVVVGHDTADDAEAVAAEGLEVALEVAPAHAPVGEATLAWLRRAVSGLPHIRLLAGGPETSLHEGRGVGAFLRELAAGGFAGTLVVAPSSPRFRIAWAAWLGRRGGWGCGSAGAALLPTQSLGGTR